MVPAPPAPLLLIHGDERFLIDEAVADWRRPTNSQQLSVEIFDSPTRLLDLRRSVSEVPLIDPERSILVRDPPQLSAAPRRGSDSAEDLAAIKHEGNAVHHTDVEIVRRESHGKIVHFHQGATRAGRRRFAWARVRGLKCTVVTRMATMAVRRGCVQAAWDS